MMKAKEYLRQIEIMSVKIEQKKQRAAEYRELAMSLGGMDYSKDRIQASISGGQLENAVIRYVSIENEIAEDTYQLQLKKDKIISEIHNLDDAKQITILYKRYVECKNLGKVSKEMGFAYQYVRSIHGEALKAFEKNFQKHTK